MPTRAPISHHLDLYRYWLSKRGSCAMPSRSDIQPADIPALLPYMCILDEVEGRFRFRLVGTAVARQFGRDLTGRFVGSYTGPPERTAMQQAIYERVFTRARPLFVAGEYQPRAGIIHKVSRFMLPLSDDGINVDKIVFTRIARFSSELNPNTDWLQGAPGRTTHVIEVSDIVELEKLCLDWEQGTLTGDAAV